MEVGAREPSAEQKKVVQDESDNHDRMVAQPGASSIRVSRQTACLKLRVYPHATSLPGCRDADAPLDRVTRPGESFVSSPARSPPMLITAGLRPLGEEGKNMRVRILMALTVVLLLGIGAATAAGARKQPYAASQALCLSHNGIFSTRANSSFFPPFYKKQGVLWTCNSYSDGSTAGAELGTSCSNDGGQAFTSISSGFATCWKNP